MGAVYHSKGRLAQCHNLVEAAHFLATVEVAVGDLAAAVEDTNSSAEVVVAAEAAHSKNLVELADAAVLVDTVCALDLDLVERRLGD